MPRTARVDVGGYCYHVLNRANARYRMFRKDGDFAAFEAVLEAAVARAAGSVELFAYCVMGNHWHLVLRPKADGAMGEFMKWLTTTHAARYRVAHKQVGLGRLYQGRYKSFLLEDDRHFLTVCRYVERNAARASLVERAERWRWSSPWRWRFGDPGANAMLSPWPAPAGGAGGPDPFTRPRGWLRTVNTPLSEAELEAVRLAVGRDRPFGSPAWTDRTIRRFGLESTIRPPGRPKGKGERG